MYKEHASVRTKNKRLAVKCVWIHRRTVSTAEHVEHSAKQDYPAIKVYVDASLENTPSAMIHVLT